MPRPIAEVDAFAPEVIVPVGSDPRTAASVEVPFQALANRTLNLKNTVDAIGGRGGVTKFREVADLDELRAIGRDDRKNGDLVLVPNLGIYRYSDSYTGVDLGVWSVKSNEPSVDNPAYGAWRHVLYSNVGTANYGLVTRDEGGRIALGMPRNGIVYLGNTHIPDTTASITASDFADTPIVSILPSSGTSAVAENDVIDVSVTWTVLADATYAIALKTVTSGGTIYTTSDASNRTLSTSVGKFTLTGRIVVPAASNVTSQSIVLRANPGGTTMNLAGQAWITTTVYRP